MAARTQGSLAGRKLRQCRSRKERLIAGGLWDGMSAQERVCNSGRRAGQSVKRSVRPADAAPRDGETSTARNRIWRNQHRARLVRPTDPQGNALPYNKGRGTTIANNAPTRPQRRRDQMRRDIDPEDRGSQRGYFTPGGVFTEDDRDTDINDDNDEPYNNPNFDYDDNDYDFGDNQVQPNNNIALPAPAPPSRVFNNGPGNQNNNANQNVNYFNFVPGNQNNNANPNPVPNANYFNAPPVGQDPFAPPTAAPPTVAPDLDADLQSELLALRPTGLGPGWQSDGDGGEDDDSDDESEYDEGRWIGGTFYRDLQRN